MSRRGYQQSTINTAYSLHVSASKRDGISPLSRPEWERIVYLPCTYCGKIDIRNEAKKPSFNAYTKQPMPSEEAERYSVRLNGVDRRDSSLGYETDNCVPCCTMCNSMKLDHAQSVFLAHITKIHSHQSQSRSVNRNGV